MKFRIQRTIIKLTSSTRGNSIRDGFLLRNCCRSERTIMNERLAISRRTRRGKLAKAEVRIAESSGLDWRHERATAGSLGTEGAKGVSLGEEVGAQCHPKIEGEKEGGRGNEGEGGCRTRRRLDAVSVGIHLLCKIREKRKSRENEGYRWMREKGITPRRTGEDDRMATLSSIPSFRASKWKSL